MTSEQKTTDDLARWILRSERQIAAIEGGRHGIATVALLGRKEAWQFLTGQEPTEENLLAAEERAEHPLRIVRGLDGE